jgi:hypothetical protein
MAYLLTLAKSFKMHGRCIAGKLVSFSPNRQTIESINEWIRPIPNGTSFTAPVPHNFCNLNNNQQLKNLDIIEINLTQPINIQGQPENHFFDPDNSWQKIGSLKPETIFQLVESPKNLWLDTNCTSDRCTPHFVNNNVEQSLYLIKVNNLQISLSKENNTYNGEIQTKTLASFSFANQRYENFSITCPAIRKMLKNQYPEPNHPPKILQLRNGDDYILCISLGPLFHNFHYKFVASIFDRTGYLQETFNS